MKTHYVVVMRGGPRAKVVTACVTVSDCRIASSSGETANSIAGSCGGTAACSATAW